MADTDPSAGFRAGAEPIPKEEQAIRKLRIAIVDDHEFFRAGVREWLQRQPGIEVCGEAATLSEARRLLGKEPTDVLLLDLSLPEEDGADFITEAQTLVPGLAVVVLSQRDEMAFGPLALRRGAAAYLMKSQGAEFLGRVLDAIRRGERWFSPSLAALAHHAQKGSSIGWAPPIMAVLSDRERQVLALLAADYGPKEVARMLGISPKTVETHRERIKTKLGIESSSALLSLARRWLGP